MERKEMPGQWGRREKTEKTKSISVRGLLNQYVFEWQESRRKGCEKRLEKKRVLKGLLTNLTWGGGPRNRLQLRNMVFFKRFSIPLADRVGIMV